MGVFSQVLMTGDFDRPLTGPDGKIPQANLKAIDRFMHDGGAFTVNTGRSLPMLRPELSRFPVNAPLLLYNGSVAYDWAEKKMIFSHPIDLNPSEVLPRIQAQFPDLLLGVQGLEAHYIFRHEPLWQVFGRENGCEVREICFAQLPSPFLKMALYGTIRDGTVSQFYEITPEQDAGFQEAERWLQERYGASLSVTRGAPRILDLQAAGTSKGQAARELARQLGRRVLVCVGDGANDASMLAAADFPFAAADGDPILTARYPHYVSCAQGVVADAIRRLPELLEQRATGKKL